LDAESSANVARGAPVGAGVATSRKSDAAPVAVSDASLSVFVGVVSRASSPLADEWKPRAVIQFSTSSAHCELSILKIVQMVPGLTTKSHTSACLITGRLLRYTAECGAPTSTGDSRR
jgi:hypothetical protein